MFQSAKQPHKPLNPSERSEIRRMNSSEQVGCRRKDQKNSTSSGVEHDADTRDGHAGMWLCADASEPHTRVSPAAPWRDRRLRIRHKPCLCDCARIVIFVFRRNSERRDGVDKAPLLDAAAQNGVNSSGQVGCGQERRCGGGERVQGVLTLFCSGAAQFVCHALRVGELSEQFEVEEEDEDRQEEEV